MKNILILTDFSKLADHTFEKAAKFADLTNAKVHVLHVVNVSPGILFDEEGNLLESNDCDVIGIKKELQNANYALKVWTANKNRNVTSEAKLGNFVDESLRYIKNENIDVVFVGERQTSKWKLIFGGSLTKNLIKKSPVQIITAQKEVGNITRDLIVGEYSKPSLNLIAQDAIPSNIIKATLN